MQVNNEAGGGILADDQRPLKPCIDWFRETRKKLSFLKAGSDPAQHKITEFCDTLLNVQSLIECNPDVMQECPSTEKFSAIFQRLISNAERNVDKQPQQIRHDIILKKFATFLFIYCGSRAYNFIHSNMPQALPSLRTLLE